MPTMYRRLISLRPLISLTVAISVLAPTFAVYPQDLIASDDITGGASVFVFRESRKKPQRKRAGASIRDARRSAARPGPETALKRKRRNGSSKPGGAVLVGGPSRRRPAAVAQSAALTAKADALFDQNSLDAAIAVYRDALRQNPKNIEAAMGLSDALTAKASQTDAATSAATQMLEEAVRLDPKNVDALVRLGDIYEAAGQSQKARAGYQNAIRLNPKAADLYVSLGMSYLSSGEIANAESTVRDAEALGISDPALNNLKGMILYKQNKNAEAMAAFENVLAVQGRNATAAYYRGLLYDRMNQPDQSINSLRQAVAAEPAYAPAWFDLGVAYYNAEQYKEAAAAYQQSLQSEPDSAQAHFNLASTYRQLERYPEANAEYARAESAGMTSNSDLYLEWGYSLGKSKEWDESARKLETARSLSPTAIDDNNVGWAYYNGAQADKSAKNDAAAAAKLQKGKASLESAVRKDDKFEAAYLNLGSTNNALGDFAAAVAALTAAVGLRKNWVIAINQLGVGYRGLNELAAAVEQFKLVTTLDAGNVPGLFNLSEAYSASGNKKEAKKVQEKLRKIDPSLANRLDSIISGKAIINETKRQIEKKIPKIPRLPF